MAKIDTVALIGPQGAVCGCAEYNRFHSEALVRAGIKVIHLANTFSGGYPNSNIYNDTPNVTRCFGTGHNKKEEQGFDVRTCVDTIIKSKARIAYLNFQDYLYPDKAGLYQALARLAASKVAVYLIIHDTCLPDLPYSLFRGIIVPSEQVRSNRFPTAARVFVIPQGVPIFKKVDRVQFRQDFGLVGPKDLMITTFGLGRSNNEEVIKAARAATAALKRDPEVNPIYVQMIFSKMSDYQDACEKWAPDNDTYLQGGYQEDFKLSAFLQAGNAVILNYPPLQGHYATSSALRFAIGSGCLVMAKESNWFADVKDQGLYMPFLTVNDLANNLANTFQSEQSMAAAEAKVARNGGNYAKKHNWDEFVKENAKVWKQTL